jgi:catechol 2,3-dioxygenase
MMSLVPFPNFSHRNAVNDGQHRRSIIDSDRDFARGGKRANERYLRHRVKTGKLRLGHVHLKVRDLNRSVPFYTRVLGLRLSEWAGRYAFLATGDEHHSLALEEVGGWAAALPCYAAGVAHVAFQVADEPDFAAMRKRLIEADLPIISRNNGISWTMRFKDPDGNEIEVYVDRRHSPGGTRLWGGRWHGPLSLEDQPKPRVAAAA